jgi:hypothetical protein
MSCEVDLIKDFPLPTADDLWICCEWCDWCEKPITQQQYDDGDVLIETYMGGNGYQRVFRTKHKICLLYSEELFTRMSDNEPMA